MYFLLEKVITNNSKIWTLYQCSVMRENTTLALTDITTHYPLKQFSNTRCEVFMAMKIQVQVFWIDTA